MSAVSAATLTCFFAWLNSLGKTAGCHDDDTIDKAIVYLTWLEENPDSIGKKGILQPYTASFRHEIRKKGWQLVRDIEGVVIGVSSPPAKNAGPDRRLIIRKSKIAETLDKYHVRDGTHTKSRRCYNLVGRLSSCCGITVTSLFTQYFFRFINSVTGFLPEWLNSGLSSAPFVRRILDQKELLFRCVQLVCRRKSTSFGTEFRLTVSTTGTSPPRRTPLNPVELTSGGCCTLSAISQR